MVLGNLNVKRDFISAIDVVEALFLLGETNRAPTDYIICGGSYFPLEKILEIVFSLKGLNFKDFVSYDQKLLRKKDKEFLWGDPTKIKKDLNWEPRYLFKDCLKEMLDFAEKLQ